MITKMNSLRCDKYKSNIEICIIHNTLPDTYQEKKAYKDAFAAGEGFVVGYNKIICLFIDS